MKAPPPALTSSSAPTIAEMAREFAGSLGADVLMPDRQGRTLAKGRRVRLVMAQSHRKARVGRVERIEAHDGRLRVLVTKRNILGEIVWSAWVGSAEVEMVERNQSPNTMGATGGLLLTRTERETSEQVLTEYLSEPTTFGPKSVLLGSRTPNRGVMC